MSDLWTGAVPDRRGEINRPHPFRDVTANCGVAKGH